MSGNQPVLSHHKPSLSNVSGSPKRRRTEDGSVPTTRKRLACQSCRVRKVKCKQLECENSDRKARALRKKVKLMIVLQATMPGLAADSVKPAATNAFIWNPRRTS